MREKRVPLTSGIYAIECGPAGKTYVGSSVNIPSRWVSHVSELSAGVAVNPDLQALWSEHGPAAFSFRILEIVPDRDLLYERELHWIRSLNADGSCLNRAGTRGEARSGIAVRSSTKRSLELLGKKSMDEAVQYLLSLHTRGDAPQDAGVGFIRLSPSHP